MSQDNINININETNPIVNIVSSEIVETIDINVGETIEEVVLNITEEVIQVNVNKVQGGGAVDSVNGQTGVVVLDATDVDALQRDGSNANSDVNIGENKFISDKGFEIPTSDKGVFKVDDENPNYLGFGFNSTDTSSDEFGTVLIIGNPEEGINLITYNNDQTINNFIGVNNNSIQVGVNDGLGNTNSVVFEPTQTTTNKKVSLPKTVFNSNTETADEKELVWNDTDGTLDLGLKGGNVTLQIGQESVIRVVNKTGSNLLESNYQAVRVDGAQGNRLKIALAQATTDLLSAETIGLVTETINNNQEGFVTTNGLVRNINTTGSLQGETWADGDMLYLSPTVAGRLTKVKPTAPNHLIVIGYVVRAHATQGQIFVKVDNGYELDELHNVAISSPVNNNVLTYNSAAGVWENKTVVQALGYTPSPNFYSLKVTTPSSYVTGTLSETEVLKVTIPANTFSANDIIKFTSVIFNKIGTNATVQFRIKLSTSATMPSGLTSQIATATTPNTSLFVNLNRTFLVGINFLKGFPFNTASAGDIGVSTNNISSVAFDNTITQYLYVSVQLANTTDQVRLEGLQLTNY